MPESRPINACLYPCRHPVKRPCIFSAMHYALYMIDFTRYLHRFGRRLLITAAFFQIGLFAVAGTSAGAELYYWIDENGVKQFSNRPPPKGVHIIDTFAEIPHNADADRERTDRDATAAKLAAEAARQREIERQAAEEKAREESERRKEATRQAALEQRVKDLEAELAAEKRRGNRYYLVPVRPPRHRPGPRPHEHDRPRPTPKSGATVTIKTD